MDITSEHRNGEITVFVNSATPEVQLTTRREEAKATVKENEQSIITVAENIEAVKDAAQYVDTFDDVIASLPKIMEASTAAKRAEKAEEGATEAKDLSVESASIASASASSATLSAQKASESETKALASEQSAQNSANSASESKTSAQNSALLAAESATSAKQDLDSIKADAEMVAEYAPKAIQAAESAEIAKASAISAAERAEQASQGVEGALADKQDKLTAGEGIKIEGNVISTEGGKLPDNVYTADNLIAGKNVTFTEVPPEGGIDEHTLACWHFDDNIIDEVSGMNFLVASSSTSYKKFGSGCLANTTNGELNISSMPYSNNNDISFDCWCILFPSASASKIGLVDSYSNYPFMYFYASGANFSARIRGTSSDGDIEVSEGVWHHLYAHYIAKENKYEMFVDGKKIASKIVETAFAVRSSYCFGRYIDELRISDCVRWTEDFTPPTEPYKLATAPSKTAVDVELPEVNIPEGIYTQTNLLGGKDIEIVPEPVDGGIDENTLACWHFTDSASDEVSGLVMNRASTLSSSYSKFGEKSLQMLSATYASDISSLGLQPTKKSMTMDFWLYNHGSNPAIIGIRKELTNTYGNLFEARINKTGTISISGTLFESGISLSETIQVSFNHYAIQYDYDNQEVSFYLNGKNIVKTKVPNVTLPANGFNYLELSCYSSNSFISELRISDCVRYTEDFTPPTKPYQLAEPTGNMVVNFVGEKLQKGADYVVESYNDGANWYRLYKSGWVEQGGSASTIANITLLKPMKDTNYTVIGVQNGTTGPSNQEGSPRAGAISTTQIWVSGGASTQNVNYYVCGQGA